MCGFCGVVRLDEQPVAAAAVGRMNATLAHRGPDSAGVWTEGPAGLGNRRLAIIDLTSAGHQPMTNESGEIVLVYNGELYNYQNLRPELEAAGHRFHSSSDTETVLHAFEEWGAPALQRFNGMFAFAAWNRRTRRLFLARDRFGVKPLYYYFDGAKLVFASEIKAILSHPGIPRKVCLPALTEYLTFQNVLTDRTLFDGIRLLPAGHHLELDLDGGGDPIVTKYWDFDFSRQLSGMSFQETAGEVERLFQQAVTRQLVSDVPVAAYLSGGMDSGSIVAVAGPLLGRLTTFTCGFDLSSASGLEMGFDERADAETLSNLLKTEHYEMVLHAGDMERVMPELIWHLEDLRVGQSYPNYCVARLAGKFAKVVLSGAGGDELFGGYPWRYFRGAEGNGGDYYRNYYNFWQRLVPEEEKRELFTENVYRQVGGYSTFDVFRAVFNDAMPVDTPSDQVNASLYFELKTFLHGLLIVEDKLSMAHSLETRVPFLDNDLADFACRIPPGYKLADLDHVAKMDENDPRKYRMAMGKSVLRAAMERFIPSRITGRVKQGFTAPDASWFRGESIDYVNRFLRDPRARLYEYVNPAFVTRKLDEHTAGRHNHRLLIWSLLSFEWWLRTFLT